MTSTAKDFVDGLANLSPSHRQLLDIGCSEAEAREFIRSYQLRRLVSPRAPCGNGPIIDIARDYNIENLIIGFVRFHFPEPRKESWICFGSADSCRLIWDGSIVFAWNDSDKKVAWNCASTQQGFLDALLISAQLLTMSLIANGDISQTVRLEYSKNAAEASGGLSNLPFYKVLNGCDV